MIKRLAPGSFFGKSQNQLTVSGIAIVESLYSDEHRIPPHEHVMAFFDFVVRGSCVEVLRGLARDRGQSTLAFHPAGEVHSSQWHGAGALCLHIEIPPALLDRVRTYSDVLDEPASFRDGLPCWLAMRIYHEQQRMDDISPLAIEAMTLELLAECARPHGRTPERRAPRWLPAVRDLLERDFSDRLTMDAIAASVGVHPAHLARVFRAEFGCSVGDFIRRCRIEFACRRLEHSDEPLAQIALAAGFSDQSHFSSTFRRRLGVSPTSYRKSVRPRKSAANECSDRTRS
jgi:AraC family transcriptional regulator